MPTCDIAIIIVCAGRHGTTERRAGAPGMNTKYDLRSWSPDHSKMGKGITLSESELTALADLLAKEVEFLKED